MPEPQITSVIEILSRTVLYILLLAIIIFVYIFGFKYKKGWLGPFSKKYSLDKMVLDSFSAVFSRWWILTIPLFLAISTPYVDYFNRWLAIVIKPDRMEDIKELCQKLSEISPEKIKPFLIGPHDWFAKSIIDALKGYYFVWKIDIWSLFALIAVIACLIWLKRAKTRDGDFLTEWELYVLKLFRIVMIVALIAYPLSLIYLYWIFTLSFKSIKLHSFTPICFSVLISVLANSIFYSIWFVSVFNAGISWHKSNYEVYKEKVFNNNIIRLDMTIKLFPLVLVLLIANGFSEVINRMVPSKPYSILILISSILNILSWSVIPLPFIILRYRLGFKEGIIKLYQTWCHHFRRLCDIVFAVISIRAIGLIVESIYSSSCTEKLTATEQCLKEWINNPDLMMIAIKSLVVFLTMFAFMLVMIAFKSGQLDLPDESKAELDDDVSKFDI